MRTAVKLSSPDVGSSSNTNLGSVISSTPIAVRLRSPPEMVLCKIEPQTVSWHSSSPKSRINSSIRSVYSLMLQCNFRRAANVRASLTVK